jgi:hypothetical protein
MWVLVLVQMTAWRLVLELARMKAMGLVDRWEEGLGTDLEWTWVPSLVVLWVKQSEEKSGNRREGSMEQEKERRLGLGLEKMKAMELADVWEVDWEGQLEKKWGLQLEEVSAEELDRATEMEMAAAKGRSWESA